MNIEFLCIMAPFHYHSTKFSKMPSKSCMGWCTGCKYLYKNYHQHIKDSPTCARLIQGCTLGPDGFCTTPHVAKFQEPIFMPNISYSFRNEDGEMHTIRACPGFMIGTRCDICGKICDVHHYAYRYRGVEVIGYTKLRAPSAIDEILTE